MPNGALQSQGGWREECQFVHEGPAMDDRGGTSGIGGDRKVPGTPTPKRRMPPSETDVTASDEQEDDDTVMELRRNYLVKLQVLSQSSSNMQANRSLRLWQCIACAGSSELVATLTIAKAWLFIHERSLSPAHAGLPSLAFPQSALTSTVMDFK